MKTIKGICVYVYEKEINKSLDQMVLLNNDQQTGSKSRADKM
jgi:hypothetical protein